MSRWIRVLAGILLLAGLPLPALAQPAVYTWVGGGSEASPEEWTVVTNWDGGVLPSPIGNPHTVIFTDGCASVTNTTWSTGSMLEMNGGCVISTGAQGFFLRGGQWTVDGGVLDIQFANQDTAVGTTSVVTLGGGTVKLRGAAEPIPVGADPDWHYNFPPGSNGRLWLPNKDAAYIEAKITTDAKCRIDGVAVTDLSEIVAGYRFVVEELDGPGLANVQVSIEPVVVSVTFRRGDANDDGVFDISDAVFTLTALFLPGSPAANCTDAMDSNDDGVSDISDAVFSLAALFVPGSPTAPSPGPLTCGFDPTPDPLECTISTCP